MKSGAQKRKENESSAIKSRKPTEFFAAFITPTNNNLAETGQSERFYQ